MQEKLNQMYLACEDFYRHTKDARSKKEELVVQSKEAESKHLYGDFRNIVQQIQANQKYQENLKDVLYEKLAEIFSTPIDSES